MPDLKSNAINSAKDFEFYLESNGKTMKVLSREEYEQMSISGTSFWIQPEKQIRKKEDCI